MHDVRMHQDHVEVPESILPEGACFSPHVPIRKSNRPEGDAWIVPWAYVLGGAAWAATEAARDAMPGQESEETSSGESDLELLAWIASWIHLPPTTPLTLYVKCRGTFATPGKLSFAHGWEVDRQPVAVGSTCGPLFLDADGVPTHCMTPQQWRVIEEIRGVSPMATEDELRRIAAHLKTTAQVASGRVRLDNYLVNEDSVEIDAIAPTLVPLPDGSGYRVEPRAEGVPADALARYTSSRGRGSIRLASGGRERRTIVFSERATRGVEAIRARPRLGREDVPRALSDPEAFFGPDLDTSAFTHRVVGVGVVTSEPRSFSSALEIGGWFEFTEGMSSSEPVSLQLDTPEQRDRVCLAIREAEARGVSWFANPFGEGYFQITAALKAAACPVPELLKPERQGLLVKTNESELELSTEPELEYFDRLAPLPELPFMKGVGLKPHQALGVRWLLTMAERRDVGALLADDMGLGKTLQILSFMVGLHQRGRRGPHLVVAPIGLLANWQSEMRRFFGDHFEDPIIVQGRARYTSTQLERSSIVLVGYDSLRLNEYLFARVRWDVVVLDEAQRVKNAQAQISRVVRALHSQFRLASTGTPVENTLDELWTIVDWVMPGLLGTRREFGRDFVEPARIGAKTGDWDALRAMSVELRRRLGRYFLRRTKSEVLDLPPMNVQRHDAPLSPEQRERYAAIVGQRRNGIVPALAALQRLFDVCAHPALGPDAGPQLPTGTSFPKAEALWSVLDDVRAREEKVIIFARRIPIQHWLADEIFERYGRRPAIINGELASSAERMSIVERFQSASGFRALVLGPRAAGVGLNITAANHVVHFTREWNPAVENQATDRSYRMGQERPVTVHHVIVRGLDDGRTVEERLDELLERKRGLMREFVVPLVPVTVEQEDFGL